MVTYNTYIGTIKGKFHSDGTTLWAAFADFVPVKVWWVTICAVQSSCFSVCYSVTKVLSPLQTLVLPERVLPSYNLLLSMHVFFTSLKPTHDRFSRREKRQRVKRHEKLEHVLNFNGHFSRREKCSGTYTQSFLMTIFKNVIFHVMKNGRVYAHKLMK